jgi:hypothetical protein
VITLADVLAPSASAAAPASFDRVASGVTVPIPSQLTSECKQ